ncbi:hypothetical protein GCM10027299_39770 [Larkinella ripae]
MSLSKEEQFNEEWRSLFENAEESPSEELWDSITRRLDEEEAETVIPLWPRAKPWIYSVAAAVVALLMGWWAMQSTETADINRPLADQTTSSSSVHPTKTAEPAVKNRESSAATTRSPEKPAIAFQASKAKPETPGNRNEPIAANKNTTDDQAVDPELERTETATTIDGIINDQSLLAESRTKNASRRSKTGAARLRATAPTRLAEARRMNRPSKPSAIVGPPETALSRNAPSTTDLATRAAKPETAVEEAADSRLAYEASYIKNKATALKDPRPISRIIWYRAPETAIEPQEKGRSKKEYWAALTATPLSFNPMTSIHSSLDQAYLSYSGVAQSSRQPTSVSLQNQAQISMAWQASSGVKLSKHWSVEAGVQYLNGRSQAQNNASVTNAFTNQTENLLVNAVRNSSPSVAQDALPQKSNSLLPANVDKNNLVNSSYLTVVPSDQLVSNNFQYIQVPVQVGYHILPERKVSYSVLGGLMGNVFLKNTIGTLEVDRADQVYRPMAVAGTAGLRINYHPTHHWSGSLTGSYQQSLQNGTQSDAQLQVRPQAVGVGFGLNYHF